MPDLVIAEFMDEASVTGLRGEFDVLYDANLVDRPDELAGILDEARGLIVRNRTQVRGNLLASGRQLECVGRLGVGLDNIDLDACKARGIEVIPATGANDLAVAEYVITAATVLLRGSWHATQSVIAGEWPRQRLMGRELSGKIMGLIGYGAIAREVAKRATDLGMRCIAYDPFVSKDDPSWQDTVKVDLDELLAKSDAISLHTPLTDDTRHLIDKTALDAMRPGSILINAARGGVVDEDALTEVLRAGKLGGAALDVFEIEPLTSEAGEKFAGLETLILTPHIAGVTEESNVRVSALIAEKVSARLRMGK